MSRILRGEAAATLTAPMPGRMPTSRIDAAAPSEADRLLARIAELEAALAESEKQRQADVIKATAAGNRAGQIEAERRGQALNSALRKAEENFKARLADLDKLAAALVRTALGKVFSDCDHRAGDVIAAIRKWLENESTSAKLTIRISQNDLEQLGEKHLAEVLGDRAADVRADKGLSAGECVIDARMGGVDIAPLSQWRELEKSFQLMLGERAP